MSFYQGTRFLPRRFGLVLASVLQACGLPFSEVLTEEEITEAFDEEDCRFAQEEGEVFTPPLTLWAFLSQVLHKEEQRSCLAAVSRIIVLLVALGREPCAKNSGGYCKARAKLPETVLQRLTTRVADGCEKAVPEAWLWKGRHVKLADGTTVSMPDTKENQREYPQQASQEPGLGFPVARMVVLLSLATAMLTGMADTQTYPRDDIAELYHKRWLVELDIRAIKCNLGMDMLRCKTPEMVRKEIWTCLLAYNLIRKTMLQAAMGSGLSPRQLSFTNAMQTMAASWVVLPVLDPSRIAPTIASQLASLTSPLVGNRPNRVEPRAVKRRPKPMRLLTMPRDAAREKLLHGVDPYERSR